MRLNLKNNIGLEGHP